MGYPIGREWASAAKHMGPHRPVWPWFEACYLIGTQKPVVDFMRRLASKGSVWPVLIVPADKEPQLFEQIYFAFPNDSKKGVVTSAASTTSCFALSVVSVSGLSSLPAGSVSTLCKIVVKWQDR